MGGKFLAASAILLALLAAAPTAGAVAVTDRNPLEASVVSRINAVRESHGLVPLRVVDRLGDAANRHARSMGSASYFRHELFTPQMSRDWTPFSVWVRWYWPGPGYTAWSAGENPTRTVSNWMASPGHRANILNPNWRNIGVAAVHVDNPAGYYRSWDDVTIVAAEFGRRS
jgi:uncharacterized protein YkwD